MVFYTYPVYVLASLIIFILLIIVVIYLLHLYNFLKNRIFILRLPAESELTTRIASSNLVMSSNRMLRCCGYLCLILPKVRRTSNVLLCQCKSVKFKRVLLDNLGSRQNLEAVAKNNDDDACDLNDTLESQLSILSIDNSLESEYILKDSDNVDLTGTPTDDPFNSVCPICLDEFELDEKILLLVCHHGFHRQCLSESLKLNASCPLCKSQSNMQSFRMHEQMPFLWRNSQQNTSNVSEV